MKLQNLLAAATIGLTTMGAAVAPAFADNYYTFNRHIGDVWVGKANLYKNTDDGGVTVTANVNMPTCDSFSHLTGYIYFSYTSKNGGYFKNYAFDVTGYEGQNNIEAYANVPYNMTTNGNLVITDATYCDF